MSRGTPMGVPAPHDSDSRVKFVHTKMFETIAALVNKKLSYRRDNAGRRSLRC